MHWQVAALSGSSLVAPQPAAWGPFTPPASNALPSNATADEVFAAQGFPGKGRPRPPSGPKPPVFPPPPPGRAAPTTPPLAMAAPTAAPFGPAVPAFVPGSIVAGTFPPCPQALHNTILKVMCVGSAGLRLEKLRWCWKCFSMSFFTGGSKCTNPGCKLFGFNPLLPVFQTESQLYGAIHDEISSIMFDRNISDCMAAGQFVQLYMHNWPALDHICIDDPEEVPEDVFAAAAESGAVPKAKAKSKAVPKTKAMPKKTIKK